MKAALSSSPSLGLSRFSKLTCLTTLVLIFMGGLVKSHEAGLSVPDWPNSYGQNMFLFPPSQWVGGIFYEHTHRLVASLVGFLTMTLALWLHFKESRRWVRVLGYAALITVIFQGVLGGLTVKFYLPVPISSAHAVLAQTFFLITILIAYSLSGEWRERVQSPSEISNAPWKSASLFVGFVFVQLVLGAVMRHTESGLALLDFPLSAGHLIPPFNEDMLRAVNATRFHADLAPVTLSQVGIHFAHRVGALIVTLVAAILAWQVLKNPESGLRLKRSVQALLCVLTLQVVLGALTVLTQKSPTLTSVHVVVGAATLGLSALILLRSYPVEKHRLGNS